jgi:ACR3 family arsenite transporter
MSIFERCLTLWAALCTVVGIAAGHVMRGVVQAIGSAEIGSNLPKVRSWL